MDALNPATLLQDLCLDFNVILHHTVMRGNVAQSKHKARANRLLMARHISVSYLMIMRSILRALFSHGTDNADL